MRIFLLRTVLTLLAWMVILPAEASAQSADPAAAETLFQEGRDALNAEDYDAACELFEKSFALDPAVGTILNLAACEEKRGRLARSWERWHQALDLLDEDDDRVGYAVLQMEAVEARLAYLTIIPQKGAPEELTLKRDDVLLGSAGLGQELPVDPGKHVIIVDSPGHESKRYTVSLELGEHKELTVTSGRPVDPGAGGSSASTRLTLGIASLGLGAAGLGLAATTGVLLPGQHQKVEQGCPNKVCSTEGSEALSGAKTLLALNTVGWVVAGVGAAAGVSLLLTLPKKEESPAQSRAGERTLGVALLGSSIQMFGNF